MGSRSIFPQIEVQTSIPMEKDKIYLLDLSTHTPLEIIPFFRMMPSPKTEENVCYFYNRVEKDGVRWISYYFERDPELIRHDEIIMEIIEKIEGFEGKHKL